MCTVGGGGGGSVLSRLPPDCISVMLHFYSLNNGLSGTLVCGKACYSSGCSQLYRTE